MKIQSIYYVVILGIVIMCTSGMIAYKSSYAHQGHVHDVKEAPTMHSDVPFRPSTSGELERFHGHVGPYVVFGSHMGEYAVTKFNMPRYFGVTVEVECPAIPPHACLIDGLMVSTGATYGKKNIHHTHAKTIRVIISDDKTGATVTFSLKPSTIAILKKWEKDSVPISERGEASFQMNANDLFDIEYTPNH